MHVTSIERLNYGRQESKTRNLLCISDTKSRSSNLEDNVDPKQGYNHAKFERFCFNGVREKKKRLFFQAWKYVIYLALKRVKLK